MTDPPSQNDPQLERYSRQIRFAPIGAAGQQRLETGRVLLAGCGALGTVIANTLVRAGVGFIRIVDRDFVELTNLQRQVLFDENDIEASLPKAVAAARHLQAINSSVKLEPIVADISPSNIESLASDVDLIMDGSDNFELRFLINDVSIKQSIPWIYGGCLGADGQTMTILPGKTACLNCLMLDGPPPPGTTPTCDSAGIVGPVINLIASIQSLEAIKLLTHSFEAVSRKLQVVSMWDNVIRQVDLSQLRDQVECPTCHQHEFKWLGGDAGSRSAVLCGRNAVQLTFPDRPSIDLIGLAERLNSEGQVDANEYLLRFTKDPFVITVFPDGRTIVSGTDEVAVARQLHSRWIGN